MKRFFCTVCKKVRRVRKYPTSVSDSTSPHPQNRIGACEWHDFGRNRPEMSRGKSTQMRDFALKNNIPTIVISKPKGKRRAS